MQEIKNPKLYNRIENLLLQNGGMLIPFDRKELKELFPDEVETIDNLSDDMLERHYKEYQVKAIRAPRPYTKNEQERGSLTSDIDKDEAELLYGILNKQAHTFNKLTEKIDEAISNAEAEDFFSTVQSGTLELYKEVSASIRSNVKLLNDVNAAINGSKTGAMEGLMALAKALSPGGGAKEEPLTTTEYD